MTSPHPADLAAVRAERRPHWAEIIKTAQATLNTLKIETGPKK